MVTEPLRRPLGPHDHAVAVYTNEAELRDHLRGFLEESLAHERYAAFVYHGGAEAGRKLAVESSPAASQLLHGGFLVVVSDREAFESEGAISHPHVEGVVASLREQAAQQRRSGVRIFVDASRRYLTTGRAEEWFRFESWLGRRLAADVGLVCAYERTTIARRLPDVLRTHAYHLGVNPSGGVPPPKA